MNPLDYCLEQAAPAGSPTYYALRYAASAQRALFAPLLALRKEWEDTVTQASDPAVAHAKLAWWAQEIASSAGADKDHPPSHPAMQALAAAPGNWHARLAPLLIAVVDAYREDLEKARYADRAALLRQIRHSNGRLAGMLACCAAMADEKRMATQAQGDTPALSDEDLPKWAVELGTATQLAHLIPLIGEHARRGRIYLPVDAMQAADVPASDILNRRYTPAMTALLRDQATQSRQALQEARTAVPKHPASLRRQQRTLLAEAAMAQRLLDEVIREEVPVLHQRIALTPVRNLLASWWGSR